MENECYININININMLFRVVFGNFITEKTTVTGIRGHPTDARFRLKAKSSLTLFSPHGDSTVVLNNIDYSVATRGSLVEQG